MNRIFNTLFIDIRGIFPWNEDLQFFLKRTWVYYSSIFHVMSEVSCIIRCPTNRTESIYIHKYLNVYYCNNFHLLPRIKQLFALYFALHSDSEFNNIFSVKFVRKTFHFVQKCWSTDFTTISVILSKIDVQFAHFISQKSVLDKFISFPVRHSRARYGYSQ